MIIAAQVEPIRARHLDLNDLAVFAEIFEIAVNGAAADFRVFALDVEIDGIGRGVVAVGAHRFQHKPALFCVTQHGGSFH